MAVADLLLNVLAGTITAVGLLLCVLGLRAWLRSGDARAGLFFAAFLGFLAQGALLSWGLFVRDRVDDLTFPLALLTGSSLLLVYLATLFSPRQRRASR